MSQEKFLGLKASKPCLKSPDRADLNRIGPASGEFQTQVGPAKRNFAKVLYDYIFSQNVKRFFKHTSPKSGHAKWGQSAPYWLKGT